MRFLDLFFEIKILDFYLICVVFSAGDWHRVIRAWIRSRDITISRIKTGPIIYKTDLIY